MAVIVVTLIDRVRLYLHGRFMADFIVIMVASDDRFYTSSVRIDIIRHGSSCCLVTRWLICLVASPADAECYYDDQDYDEEDAAEDYTDDCAC